MANLLVIENWVEGSGRLLPQLLAQLDHKYTFVTRSLEHYQGGGDTKHTHPIIRFASQVIEAETNDVEGLIALLTQHHQDSPFDGVMTICDYYIGTVGRVARALNLPQAFSSNVDNTRCKHYVRGAIQAAGLANAKFAVTSNWPQTLTEARVIGYPLIIKPSDLASSAFVRLVHDEAELQQAFSELASFTHNFRAQKREPLWLLEEFLDGPEVSVEAYTYQGETTLIGITDKSVTGLPFFIEDGHMFPADLDANLEQEIGDYVIQVLVAVGHDHGISHTEVKLTKDGPRIVEINPRPGGNYIAELIEHVTGINMLKMHIDLALGVKPDTSSFTNVRGSAAVKFLVPNRGGVVEAVRGTERFDQNNNIVRWQMKPLVGVELKEPVDNACYLGHVLTRDVHGRKARNLAESAVASIQLEYVQAEIV